ncbi:MAG: hypothetical protein H0U71_03725 [Gammaproteobacteria bacterium]|nr:hypothetical protein [Gammaproteobacteria bacterium]
MRRVHPAEGFTLLEILLVLSMVATLLLMSVPTFNTYHEQTQLALLTQQITEELYMARNKAITIHRKIRYVCSESGDKKRYLAGEEGEVLQRFGVLPSQYHLSLHNSLSKNAYLTFMPEGFTNAERGSFYLQGPCKSVRIVIGVCGKVRVES